MDAVKEHRYLFIFEGILFILLGLLAIAVPGIFTIGIEQLLGWLFVISGVVQAYRSFKMHKEEGWLISLLSAFIYLVIGFLLLAYPLQGVFSLTILLTAFFIIEGVIKIVFGFQLRFLDNWLWLVLSGIISLAMAAIIIAGWPSTAVWVLGLLVGINMLFFGFTLIALVISTPEA